MFLLLIISVATTVFLLTTFVVVALTSERTIQKRLEEIAASKSSHALYEDESSSGLMGVVYDITSFLKPIRDLITSNDEDIAYRLQLAGYRKPKHVELYAAAKMLFPVLLVAGATFSGGSNIFILALMGGALGFFAPDFVVTQLITLRRDKIREALPNAIDLLVICMEAGLGVDQALVRVGEEVRLTCPELAEEFGIINREQRAGKPRLEAWRSMSDRLDIDYVRQFIAMLVQTERFGTPIAHALGQFADGLRLQRTQIAQEKAAKTGVKLLFPLVLFIFPSIFVVVLLPALLNIAKGISEFLK
jgi:tight adherence protein C